MSLKGLQIRKGVLLGGELSGLKGSYGGSQYYKDSGTKTAHHDQLYWYGLIRPLP